jgi:hypothetical protein
MPIVQLTTSLVHFFRRHFGSWIAGPNEAERGCKPWHEADRFSAHQKTNLQKAYTGFFPHQNNYLHTCKATSTSHSLSDFFIITVLAKQKQPILSPVSNHVLPQKSRAIFKKSATMTISELPVGNSALPVG